MALSHHQISPDGSVLSSYSSSTASTSRSFAIGGFLKAWSSMIMIRFLPPTIVLPPQTLAWSGRTYSSSFRCKHHHHATTSINAALVWNRGSLTASNALNMSRYGSSSSGSSSNEWHPTLLLRGGGEDDRNTSTISDGKRFSLRHISRGIAGRRGLSASSTSASTTNNPAENNNKDKDSATAIRIEKEAQASRSIVGTSLQISTIETIPYLNTKDCQDFRVLFVLGGPGAGTFDV